MTADRLARRHLLRTSLITALGLSGCVSGNGGSSMDSSPSPTDDEPTTTQADTAERTTRVASVSVSDFILYPLAGTHPHVHRRANTQYVIVRLDSSVSVEGLRNRLTLEVDSSSIPLADRQPVPWQHDASDVAFALSKDETVESGRLLFDQTEIHSLSTTIPNRLNTPPLFDVSDPSVTATEVQAGTRREVTVTFRLANIGDGRGEFGASLKGNYVSGANTLTATVDAGTTRQLYADTTIVGEDDAATIRLDWGSGEWTTDIPVVGTPTGSETPTQTPAPK